MKKIKLIPIILLSALILSALTPALADASDEPAAPELLSGAAVIAEAGSGRVLYELGGSERRYPASITKEMTVLLAVEAIERGEASLGDAVTAGPETLEGMSPDGSTEEVKEGETMSLGDLLYCAMLSSANEVCNVIAVHISGSIESFVAEMNERAAAIGCEDTHFANTHGLHDEDHYSTAYDLMLITRECMTHELFLEIASTTRYTVPATNMSGERSLSNTNGLINPETRAYPGYFYEYARAGKTGHTNEAGFCLASMAEREGVELVCVVLGGRAEANSDGSTAYTNFSDSRTLQLGLQQLQHAGGPEHDRDCHRCHREPRRGRRPGHAPPAGGHRGPAAQRRLRRRRARAQRRHLQRARRRDAHGPHRLRHRAGRDNRQP